MNNNILTKLTGNMVSLVVLIVIALNVLMYYFAFEYTPPIKKTTVTYQANTSQPSEMEVVKDGIHIETGLVMAEGFEIVRANCTACHSSKLITQNRATREGWVGMIRWMQETQKLWDLGENEEKIVNYLSTHYAPEKVGRRKNLDNIDWYVLEE